MLQFYELHFLTKIYIFGVYVGGDVLFWFCCVICGFFFVFCFVIVFFPFFVCSVGWFGFGFVAVPGFVLVLEGEILGGFVYLFSCCFTNMGLSRY